MALTDSVPSSAFDVLQRNAQDVDKFANTSSTFVNRVGDNIKPIQLIESEGQAVIDSLGFVTLDPLTFETGATITSKKQLLEWAVADGGDGFHYYWSGALPKTVPAASTPAGTGGVAAGAWLVQDDLEQRLAAGTADVGGVEASIVGKGAKALSYSNSEQKHFLSCIPRVSSGGVAGFVNDSEHETIGFNSIEQPTDFILRVNYSNTYQQVNFLSVTIDDELCKYGVSTGASVGVGHSDFTAYAQLSGLIDTTAMTFTGSGLFPDGDAVSVSYVDDVLIVDHDNHAFTNDSAVVTQVYGLSFMSKFGISQNASQINIIPWTELAGSIIYDGANFVNNPAKPWLISSTQTGITLTWDGTVNALKVTHPISLDYVVHVSAELGGYSEFNVEVNSLSSFRIYFFDSAGTQITSPNTNMKLIISRPSCQVRGKIPTGAKFHLRAGITPIRSANIGNASGSNFWINAMMQTPI